MHIKSAKIKNVRSFEAVDWEVGDDNLTGWHVIIGDNGAGKSTFLRCLALALIGPKEIQGLRENWETWPRIGTESEESSVELRLIPSHGWEGPEVTLLSDDYLDCGVTLRRPGEASEFEVSGKFHSLFTDPFDNPSALVWNKKREGWFSASYGPFRRFTGGDIEKRVLFHTHPSLARHLSVFGENVALTECLEWLSQLRFEELDGNAESGYMLKNISSFVNQPDFLPHGVRFDEVNSKGVIFKDPEGKSIDVTRLSDGFRSVLSMTFELIRQLTTCYSDTPLFLAGDESAIGVVFRRRKDGTITINAPGVVLIDEIDAHLHPTWQRKIGFWLTKHFPNLQFIVTTHSPLVCQAAENGTIFRLPTPGSDQTEGGFVTGADRERLIHGDVLDAYGTELFGKDVDRSDVAQEKLDELARLNQKALQRGLTEEEEATQMQLKRAFSAHLQSPFQS